MAELYDITDPDYLTFLTKVVEHTGQMRAEIADAQAAAMRRSSGS